MVVGAVTLGRVMGALVPICTTPELETTISPSDRVHVVVPARLLVGVVVGTGDSTNVSPSNPNPTPTCREKRLRGTAQTM
jgi:hypothetical protein